MCLDRFLESPRQTGFLILEKVLSLYWADQKLIEIDRRWGEGNRIMCIACDIVGQSYVDILSHSLI